MDETTSDGANVDPKTITIHYNENPPASGKSEFFKRLIVEEPTRYLLAVPTQKLLGERANGKDGLRLRFAAAGLPPSAEVVTISTATHARSVPGHSPRRPTFTGTASMSSWSAPTRRS